MDTILYKGLEHPWVSLGKYRGMNVYETTCPETAEPMPEDAMKVNRALWLSSPLLASGIALINTSASERHLVRKGSENNDNLLDEGSR